MSKFCSNIINKHKLQTKISILNSKLHGYINKEIALTYVINIKSFMNSYTKITKLASRLHTKLS